LTVPEIGDLDEVTDNFVQVHACGKNFGGSASTSENKNIGGF
jgi:hypothetical protein